MKAILKLKESQVGDISIVIPKIRDYHKSFSSVIVTYENGNTRSIEANDLNALMNQIDEAIENFYSKA
ncbi:MAG: hypothetical protein WCX83_02125 [Candidatus Cloacimonas sp.]|nr:hypothetical protein [Candidatus Cloacimonadota bacterium]